MPRTVWTRSIGCNHQYRVSSKINASITRCTSTSLIMMNNDTPCDLTRLFYASTTHTHTHTHHDWQALFYFGTIILWNFSDHQIPWRWENKKVRQRARLPRNGERRRKKKFESFADFNWCGPSLNVIKRCQSGYTTESGTMKPHLLSLFSLCQHPKADLRAIVDTKKVRVIPVSLASDGTALKPGLEYDPRQKQVIGLTDKMDEKSAKKHPLPDPEKIKSNLITSADVTIATSPDNGAAMPVTVFSDPNRWLENKYFPAWKIALEPYKPVKIAWKFSVVLNILCQMKPHIV